MDDTKLTMALVAAQPQRATETLRLRGGEEFLYRPLLPADGPRLAAFLAGLSPMTRRWWNLDAYDRGAAEEMCAAINRYDKFRMVALDGESAVIALFEFSFALVEADLARFRAYGIDLKEDETCRFGPCVRDDYQDRGLGTALMPSTLRLARRFGKRCVILWGGVLRANERAIHFYRKHGFQRLGDLKEPLGRDSCDMILYL